MTQLKMLTAADTLAEIRRLYFSTNRQTIQQDLTRALDLLKSMSSEEERERATVYMEGLAEMQRDWSKVKPGGPGRAGGTGKPGRSIRPKGSDTPGGAGTERPTNSRNRAKRR